MWLVAATKLPSGVPSPPTLGKPFALISPHHSEETDSMAVTLSCSFAMAPKFFFQPSATSEPAAVPLKLSPVKHLLRAVLETCSLDQPVLQQASTQRVIEQWGFVVAQIPKINQFHRTDESQWKQAVVMSNDVTMTTGRLRVQAWLWCLQACGVLQPRQFGFLTS